MFKDIKIDRCGRHCHLSAQDLQILFPNGVTRDRDLAIPGEYTIKERVAVLKGGKIWKPSVSVILPTRKVSYLELSATDAYGLFPAIDENIYFETEEQLARCPDVLISTKDDVISIKAGIQLPHLHVDNAEGKERIDVQIKNVFSSTILSQIKVKENPGTPYPILHIDGDLVNAYSIGAIPPTVSEVDQLYISKFEDIKEMLNTGNIF